MQLRTALLLAVLTASPAIAAEPTFTKEEVQAAYALGQADAMRQQLANTPAARSMSEKLKQQAPVPEATKK